MLHDGNGWSAGPDGTKCWGRFGAAWLVVVATDRRAILMQHRAEWTSCPLTWGVPGGARDSHETAEVAAIREAYEETAIDENLITVRDTLLTAGPYPADPQRPELAGDWTYHTVIALADTAIATNPNAESLALEWVVLDDVDKLNLLPAFRNSWPQVRQRIEQLLAAD